MKLKYIQFGLLNVMIKERDLLGLKISFLSVFSGTVSVPITTY